MVEAWGESTLGLRERKKRCTRSTLIDAAVALCDRQGAAELDVYDVLDAFEATYAEFAGEIAGLGLPA